MIKYSHQSDHKQEIRVILWKPLCFLILISLPAKFSPADSQNELGIPKFQIHLSTPIYNHDNAKEVK